MSGLMIAQVKVKDAQLWEEYKVQSSQLLQQYGGEVLALDPNPEPLAGAQQTYVQAVLRFPNKQVIREWYDSDTYQGLIPLRDAAAEVHFIGIETLA